MAVVTGVIFLKSILVVKVGTVNIKITLVSSADRRKKGKLIKEIKNNKGYSKRKRKVNRDQ